MVGVILYTILEFVNFYLAYRCVFSVRFTKKRWPYVMLIVGACVVQIVVRYLVDDTWRDVIAIIVGLFAAVCLTVSKKYTCKFERIEHFVIGCIGKFCIFKGFFSIFHAQHKFGCFTGDKGCMVVNLCQIE